MAGRNFIKSLNNPLTAEDVEATSSDDGTNHQGTKIAINDEAAAATENDVTESVSSQVQSATTQDRQGVQEGTPPVASLSADHNDLPSSSTTSDGITPNRRIRRRRQHQQQHSADAELKARLRRESEELTEKITDDTLDGSNRERIGDNMTPPRQKIATAKELNHANDKNHPNTIDSNASPSFDDEEGIGRNFDTFNIASGEHQEQQTMMMARSQSEQDAAQKEELRQALASPRGGQTKTATTQEGSHARHTEHNPDVSTSSSGGLQSDSNFSLGRLAAASTSPNHKPRPPTDASNSPGATYVYGRAAGARPVFHNNNSNPSHQATSSPSPSHAIPPEMRVTTTGQQHHQQDVEAPSDDIMMPNFSDDGNFASVYTGQGDEEAKEEDNNEDGSGCIVAELAPSDTEVEERITEKLRHEMEIKLAEEVSRRLQEEREQQHQRRGSVAASAEIILATTIAIDENDENASQPRQQDPKKVLGLDINVFGYVVMFLLAVIVAVVVGVVVGATKTKEIESITTTQTESPNNNGTKLCHDSCPWVGNEKATDLRRLLYSYGINLTILNDNSTSQYAAFEWLVLEDEYSEDSEYCPPRPNILVERYALTVLYAMTHGTGWVTQNNFISNTSVCEWIDIESDGGVSCDTSCSVIGLNLAENDLENKIPTELALLSSLEHLDLHDNELLGKIPSALGMLTALTALELQFNNLQGTVPSEIGGLENLRAFGLEGNNLEGSLDDSVCLEGSTINIERLSANCAGNPPEIYCSCCSTCCNAKGGDCTSNSAQSETSHDFEMLLDRIGPMITHDPSLFESATSHQYRALQWLADEDTYWNVDFQDQTLVERYALTLFYEATGGQEWKDKCNFLTNISVCEWRCEDSDLGALCDDIFVSKLALDRNELKGSIPSELALLSSVRELSFNGNQLSGDIPPNLFTMSNLERFKCGKNALTGILPSDLGRMTNLEELILNNNMIEGSVPTTLGLMNELREISLSGNMLVGRLPTETGMLSNLQQLNLTENILTGVVPSELGNCRELTAILLDENEFTGTIPTSFGTLSSLVRLRLSRNFIGGSLPIEIFDLSELEELVLNRCNLEGNILSPIGNLRELKVLNLGGDTFSGRLPTEIGNLRNLTQLSVNDNNLSGDLPTEIGFLTALTHLHLNGNSFAGAVPTQYNNLRSLIGVYLQENTLAGDLISFCSQGILFEDLEADCLGSQPEITCSCCTVCCNASNICENQEEK